MHPTILLSVTIGIVAAILVDRYTNFFGTNYSQRQFAVSCILGAFLSWLALFVLSGCADAKATKVEYTQVIKVGKTLDAGVIPSNYNESIKTWVRTDMAQIVVEGARSVLLNREASVRIAKNGDKWFCVGDDDACHRMY